jgi:hypothetical protein
MQLPPSLAWSSARRSAGYLDRQVIFLDRHLRPNSIHDLFFGDDLAVPLKEEIQDFRSA